jgi:general secretion pathway protein G
MTSLCSARSAALRSHAFTLVEILIVVIILGILAAIVIPQFANASTDARKANMISQLQSLRSFVELYRLQHRDQPPLLLTGGGWELVTGRTLQDGTIDAAGEFGPYLPNPAVNPLTSSSVIAEVGASSGPNVGWYYDESTGDVHGANSLGEMSDTGT